MESLGDEDKSRSNNDPAALDDLGSKFSFNNDSDELVARKEENGADSINLEDNSWIDELECALLADCDPATLKKISEGKRLPRSLRADFWKALLAITSSSKVSLCKEFNLTNQSQIRKDCEQLVDELSCHSQDPSFCLAPISDTKKMALRSDLESTLTTYIKARPELQYVRDNGWIEILKILYFLELNDVHLYQMFLRIVDRYIPKDLTINDYDKPHYAKLEQSDITSIPLNEHTASSTTTSHSIASKSIQAYHLLRLLLLYHDPELCSILDSKKVTPDLYSKDWFCSLFARCCSTAITLVIWDAHFKMADPFLIFFAAIVMVVNARDDLKNQNLSQKDMIDTLGKVPTGLQEDDIDDLYYLVSNHYANFTPRSIRAYSHLFFMDTFSNTFLGADTDGRHTLIDVKTNQLTQRLDLSQYLCLPIVPAEIVIPLNTIENRSQLSSDTSQFDSQQSKVVILKYFLVDCRPAEQYNAGHLTRAFHLDCSLMLREPSAFSTAVQALLDIQRQIIASGSQTGGQHLCFIGSGRDEEDRYVNMVVASFLQKYQKYVSIVIGGFDAIHDFVSSKQELNNNFNRYIVDHNSSQCLTCKDAPDKFGSATNFKGAIGNRGISSAQSLIASTAGFLKNYERNTNLSSLTASLTSTSSFNQTGSILDKFTSAFVNRSTVIKEKFVESLTQPPGSVSASSTRHVSQNDKLGKRYTGRQARYAIDDNDDSVNDSDEIESGISQEIQIESWCKQDNIIASFKCTQIKKNVQYPGYIALSDTHLWILREIPHNKGFARIVAKRPLDMIVRITSKRRQPESIIFRYGHSNPDQPRNSESGDQTGETTKQQQPQTMPEIVASDHLNIPQAFEVIRLVKKEVVRIMDGLSRSTSESNENDKSSSDNT